MWKINEYMQKPLKILKSFFDLYTTRRSYPFLILLADTKFWYCDGVVTNLNYCSVDGTKTAAVCHSLKPLLVPDNSYYFKKHQSNWQSKQLVKSLNECDFSVDHYGIEKEQSLRTSRNYDFLLGTTPHFFSFVEQLPDETPCVFYNAGNHWEYQNNEVDKRLSQLNSRRKSELTNTRTAAEYDVNLSDYIIIVGDEFTKQTYTDRIQSDIPVFNIPNAGYDELNILSEDSGVKKDYPDCLTNFLWLGGTGPVLKGLDLVLEAFADLPEFDLYVCGPLDESGEFETEYSEELYQTENIHTLGWVDIFSDKFHNLTNRCGYFVSASCSEGMSGSVINSMHRGLIPIATDKVGVDVTDIGFHIEPTVDSIKDVVRATQEVDKDNHQSAAVEAAEEALNNYSRTKYKEKLSASLREILSNESI